jgi:hypothetical protein
MVIFVKLTKVKCKGAARDEATHRWFGEQLSHG